MIKVSIEYEGQMRIPLDQAIWGHVREEIGYPAVASAEAYARMFTAEQSMHRLVFDCPTQEVADRLKSRLAGLPQGEPFVPIRVTVTQVEPQQVS